MKDTDINDVLRRARRSQYQQLAEVIEHYIDHDTNQYGPLYQPMDAPHQDRVDVWHVMWAFRAGRAYEATPDNSEGQK